MTYDPRKPIPREDLFYPYVCHAYWHDPENYHVIYTKGRNPIIVATFKDEEEGKLTAKQLNKIYLSERDNVTRDIWKTRDLRRHFDKNDKSKLLSFFKDLFSIY